MSSPPPASGCYSICRFERRHRHLDQTQSRAPTPGQNIPLISRLSELFGLTAVIRAVVVWLALAGSVRQPEMTRTQAQHLPSL